MRVEVWMRSWDLREETGAIVSESGSMRMMK